MSFDLIETACSFGMPDERPYTQPEPWRDLYLLSRYKDIAQDNSLPYGVIPLTRDYFAIVDKKDLARLMKYKWRTNLQVAQDGSILAIYAVRKSTKKERSRGWPWMVYMHRQVTGTITSGRRIVVDHCNGHQLDNRRCNLAVTGQSENVRNNSSDAFRTRHRGLLVGVKPLTYKLKSDEVKIYGYKGRIRIRGVDVISKVTFSDPLRAREWYLKVRNIVHPERKKWAGEKEARIPVFPSRDIQRTGEEIPF